MHGRKAQFRNSWSMGKTEGRGQPFDYAQDRQAGWLIRELGN